MPPPLLLLALLLLLASASADVGGHCDVEGVAVARRSAKYVVGKAHQRGAIFAACDAHGAATCFEDPGLADAPAWAFPEVPCDAPTIHARRRKLGVAINLKEDKWPNGLVFYRFSEKYPLADKEKDMVRQAIAMYEATDLGVAFQECEPKELCKNMYVDISQKEDACYSYVGFTGEGGGQIMNLGKSCFEEPGTAVHELGHALGLYHEHTHPQREVIVLTDANLPVSASNYAKETDALLKPYDKASIMHYGRSAGLCLPKDQYPLDSFCDVEVTTNCVMPKKTHCNNTRNNEIGQRKTLSDGDLNTLKAIYGTQKPTKKPTPAPSASNSTDAPSKNSTNAPSSSPPSPSPTPTETTKAPQTTAPPTTTQPPTPTPPSPSTTTTAPPPASTTPQPSTSAPSPSPTSTTSAPATTTPAPSTTAPTPTTSAPDTTSKAPTPTTMAPSPSTAAPEPTTTAPASTTTPPTPTTTAPASTTVAPVPTTMIPVPNTTAPVPSATSRAPATTAPASSTPTSTPTKAPSVSPTTTEPATTVPEATTGIPVPSPPATKVPVPPSSSPSSSSSASQTARPTATTARPTATTARPTATTVQPVATTKPVTTQRPAATTVAPYQPGYVIPDNNSPAWWNWWNANKWNKKWADLPGVEGGSGNWWAAWSETQNQDVAGESDYGKKATTQSVKTPSYFNPVVQKAAAAPKATTSTSKVKNGYSFRGWWGR